MIRRALLESTASTLGETWLRDSQAALRAEGRRLEGGWPGTLSEARARMLAHVQANKEQFSHEEMEHAARALYAKARGLWLSSASPEEDAP